MSLMKRKYRLQKTERGVIDGTFGLWMCLYLAVLLVMCIQLDAFRSAAGQAEDAVAMANLAAAVMDLPAYGTTNEVVIPCTAETYNLFYNALQENLGQKDRDGSKTIFTENVKVEHFIIYNVTDAYVESTEMVGGNVVHRENGLRGTVCSPNGIVVENTGIYSEISCTVRGVFGIKVPLHKGKLVDIVRNAIG